MRTTWRWLGVKDGKFDAELAVCDKEALKVIHDAQVEKYGKDVVGDFPNLTEFPVVLALVAERGGEVVDGALFETFIEFCMVGLDAGAAASLRREAPAIVQRFQSSGFRMMRTFVPNGDPSASAAIGSELQRAGFAKQDAMYEHFLLDMRLPHTSVAPESELLRQEKENSH